MSDCFPDVKCRCCVCNHKHCLMWHPGHSHMDQDCAGIEDVVETLWKTIQERKAAEDVKHDNDV